MVFGRRLNDKSLLKLAQSWKPCYDECIQSRNIWFLCKHILLSVQGCPASNMLFNPFLVLLLPRIAKFCCQNHFDTVFLSLYFDMKSSHSHTTQKLALQLTNPICHHLACSLLGFGDSSAHLEGFLLTILAPPPYQACVPNHNQHLDENNFPQIPTYPQFLTLSMCLLILDTSIYGERFFTIYPIIPLIMLCSSMGPLQSPLLKQT